ncbi:acyl transferase [Xanthovirga aplysinae]|uniref:acyl transferase n=1 Tax=Xanthovirga aplysinae TaxID=2529853 RepID=UPI0012BCADF4|nr:acyl transferase [Xanthovirga aplysinae]MTI31404.1 acyl transferase [Xanthovirga aplysinae]
MELLKEFKKELFNLREDGFNEFCLRVFRFQAVNNPVYHEYLSSLGIKPDSVNEITSIPFLPISFFKTHKVKTGNWEAQAVFESSGTTGQQTSQHFVEDLKFYEQVTQNIFENFYGPLKDFTFLALLPSYLERGNASLVAMMDHFIRSSNDKLSGFYLHNYEELIRTLNRLQTTQQKKVVLVGVTFALLDLAEQYPEELKEVILMETGGMKGRRKEMIREQLHEILKAAFYLPSVHSEYGMTELLSQAYSKGDGFFHTPKWMKIILRDLNDPFDLRNDLRQGGINVIDLANLHSCCFIETKDIGRIHPNGGFEVLGRFDNSDIRGCNLLVVR